MALGHGYVFRGWQSPFQIRYLGLAFKLESNFEPHYRSKLTNI
jgi:hypothetical protein